VLLVSADRKAVGQIDAEILLLPLHDAIVSADRKAVGQIDFSAGDFRCRTPGVSRSESRWPDRPLVPRGVFARHACQPIGKPLARSTWPASMRVRTSSGVSRSESRWPDRQTHQEARATGHRVSADRKAVGQIDLGSPAALCRNTQVSADRKAVGQIDMRLCRRHVPGRPVSADRKAVGQIDSM